MRDWLKKIRQDRKMTQEDVARLVGITAQYYCLIENGQRRPSSTAAIKIANVLGFKEWYNLLAPKEAFSQVACESAG